MVRMLKTKPERHVMKKAVFTLLIPVVFSLKAFAGPAGPMMPNSLDIRAADLSSKIGSTMFAFYQVNYHEQLVVIPTLRYCGAEDLAEKIIAGLPGLPAFYLQNRHQQLVYDMINKEAVMDGYELNSEEEFENISNMSLVQGQSYFMGYLKGYQVALESFLDKEVMQPFCQAALDEGGRYIKKEPLVSQGD